MTQISTLMCEEVLDVSDLNKTPEHRPGPMLEADQSQWVPWESPSLTVKAIQDKSQIKDVRILQNLLRNEDRFMPCTSDYMNTFQPMITAEHRAIVTGWMLEIIREEHSQTDVFCLAVNIMDRFLSQVQVHKDQFQLLAAVCVLIASKIREPCSIPGKHLIIYSDYSITAEELKEWELMVLYKMQWELSAITPLDYLDHTLPRLGLEDTLINMTELRDRTESILVMTTQDYQFTYSNASLMAASAIMTALQSLSYHTAGEIKSRLQAATLTSIEQLDKCTAAIDKMLPENLKGLSKYFPQTMEEADSTTPDLICNEQLHNSDASNISSSSETTTFFDDYPPTPTSRSSSPLSAVDIFTDFNTNVLQPMFDSVETKQKEGAGSNPSCNTILVS